MVPPHPPAKPVGPRRQLGADLQDLVEKYELLDLLTRGGPGRTVERRDAIRAITKRFPGAMREWDDAPAAELDRRREAAHYLRRIFAEDPAAAEALLALPEHACLRYAIDLHARLRAALVVKRWLRGRPVSDDLAATAKRDFGVDRARVECISAPPGGRYTQVVYAELAAAHGVSVEELKAALFPARRDDSCDTGEH